MDSEGDGKALACELQKAMKDPTRYGASLFVLDGLDEVYDILDDNGNSMNYFLRSLLNLPWVIVTSRPHGSLTQSLTEFDLELETIGFSPDQVRAYIEQVFTAPDANEPGRERAKSLHSFLRHRPLLQGLVRIPIQLDALCFVWNDRDSGLHSKSTLDTMTAVYQAIAESLWKKDILKLETEHKRKAYSPGMDGIKSIVPGETYFLEGLAFTGLINDIIEFWPKDCRAVSEEFQQFQLPNSRVLPEKTLPRLSFLRTSDPLSNSRNYHFLHLTYQEYFAAQYFVRQWKDQKRLRCLKFCHRENNEVKEVESATFLRDHKYDIRYDIFWRFVAGLLNPKNDPETPRFFMEIEEEPRDLLGSVHQRLVMHCLSEVPSCNASAFSSMREKREDRLSKWVLFECALAKESQFVCEMELSELTLKKALDSADEDRTVLLQSLKHRPIIPPSANLLACHWFERSVSRELDLAILSLLERQSNTLNDKILKSVVAKLDNKGSGVREVALTTLQGQRQLSNEILQAIVGKLDNEGWSVRWAALTALQGQRQLSDEVLQAIIRKLDDEDWRVREAASTALKDQPQLSDEILQAIVGKLDDEDSRVREAAFTALQGQRQLSDEVLQAIVGKLDNEDSRVREMALTALQGQRQLSDEVLQAIAGKLDDKESRVRRAASTALQGQRQFSDEVLQAIVGKLDNEDSGVRRAAITALRGQPQLSDEILQTIAGKLNDGYFIALGAFLGKTGKTKLDVSFKERRKS
ncbi:hypothetical protein PG994_009444 [Apiospora phragmitis]|uniref:DUF7068 domain-containing protein n=1 Tax=Apiospora phragmitis TaxID=2905665 RepID=A0ABR1UJA9_9PEZI